jgi:thiol-disulfide isomerase/thioredoxin
MGLLVGRTTAMLNQHINTRSKAAVVHVLGMTLLLCPLAGYARGNSAVDLNLRDLSGTKVRARDYQGKIVVLNFWATWCDPCREEMPRLVEAEKEYGSRGVVFVGVSLDDDQSKDKIPAFVRDHGIVFPIWIGASGDDLDRLDMGPAVPATAFLDQQGHIVSRVCGEIRTEEIKERLDWLTQGQTGLAPQPRVVHLDGKTKP